MKTMNWLTPRQLIYLTPEKILRPRSALLTFEKFFDILLLRVGATRGL